MTYIRKILILQEKGQKIEYHYYTCRTQSVLKIDSINGKYYFNTQTGQNEARRDLNALIKEYQQQE